MWLGGLVQCEACVEENCAHAFKGCTGLGQAKGSNGCPENTEEYCNGSCWPGSWFDTTAGNGQCEPAMDCEAKGMTVETARLKWKAESSRELWWRKRPGLPWRMCPS